MSENVNKLLKISIQWQVEILRSKKNIRMELLSCITQHIRTGKKNQIPDTDHVKLNALFIEHRKNWDKRTTLNASWTATPMTTTTTTNKVKCIAQTMECDKLAQWNLMSIVQGLLSKCNEISKETTD